MPLTRDERRLLTAEKELYDFLKSRTRVQQMRVPLLSPADAANSDLLDRDREVELRQRIIRLKSWLPDE